MINNNNNTIINKIVKLCFRLSTVRG